MSTDPSQNPAKTETLAIPKSLREAVDERDQLHCRVCGSYLDQARALHHIHYGGNRTGMGGRRVHALTNLITVCWGRPDNCHDLVHAHKQLWLPLLEQLTVHPAITGMQLRRWQATRKN